MVALEQQEVERRKKKEERRKKKEEGLFERRSYGCVGTIGKFCFELYVFGGNIAVGNFTRLENLNLICSIRANF